MYKAHAMSDPAYAELLYNLANLDAEFCYSKYILGDVVKRKMQASGIPNKYLNWQ